MVRKSAVPFVYGRVYMKGGQIRLRDRDVSSVRSVGRSFVGRPAGRPVGRSVARARATRTGCLTEVSRWWLTCPVKIDTHLHNDRATEARINSKHRGDERNSKNSDRGQRRAYAFAPRRARHSKHGWESNPVWLHSPRWLIKVVIICGSVQPPDGIRHCSPWLLELRISVIAMVTCG